MTSSHSSPVELGLRAVTALKAGDRATALSLIAQGADVNARDGSRDSVLLYGGANGMIDVVGAALAAGGDLAVTNRFGGIAIIPASERGHVEMVRMLIDAGSDLDHVNNLGWTALHEAIVLGDGGTAHSEIVRLLLAAGADPSLEDGDGTTPARLASARGYMEMEALISAAVAARA